MGCLDSLTDKSPCLIVQLHCPRPLYYKQSISILIILARFIYDAEGVVDKAATHLWLVASNLDVVST